MARVNFEVIVLLTLLVLEELVTGELQLKLLSDEKECPLLNNLIDDLYFSSNKIPLGTPHRAWRTIPTNWVMVTQSRITEAGLGAIATTFIPRYTWLGQYDGQILTPEESDDDDDVDFTYTWVVTKRRAASYYIDATDVSVSNWLRYVNCPRDMQEENVEVSMCHGTVQYRTSRDIAPGMELFVDYGEDYRDYLNITAVFTDKGINDDYDDL